MQSGVFASLRAKWTLVLLVVALAPLLAVGGTTVGIQRRGLARAEKELEVAVVAEGAASIDQTLRGASDATHRVGSVLGDGRIASDDARLELAEEALARADVLESVTVYDARGEPLDAIRHKGSQPGAEQALAKLPLATVEHASEGRWVEGADATGEVDLRYVEPMRAPGGGHEVRGWVAGHLAKGALSKTIGQVSQDRFAVDSRVLVVDGTFHVIATRATGGLSPGRDVRGQDIFASGAWNPADWTKDFGLTTEFEDAEHVPMVGTVRTMPERGWLVVARRPESDAFAALAEARHAFGAALAVVAALAIAAGAWLARRTTAPIESLVALTRAYAGRDFKRRSDVRTNDELEELGGALGAMADTLASSEVEIARRAAVEAGLSRYLPAEVARSIAEGKSRLELGGERRELAVLFADVAAFTSFSERASPERVVRFLNELFSILSEVVFRHGGMVDKFMGDCIMAVFTETADGSGRSHVERAVAAAEDMHRFVETQSAAWKREYDFDVRLGIGVAAGAALVGNLGSDARMEYTAIGDTVNVASRLEALARPGQTLATRAVADGAKSGFEWNALGPQIVRGKAEPIEILELLT
jgi:class 3 adenylate cyclase